MFQDGHGAGALSFTARPMDMSMLILFLCIAFGLSMDYEVFLISRIKELHDRGMPTAEAVTTGLARTGRIVSAAAALLAVSLLAFAAGTVSFLQMFGIGAGLAIVLDATLVRAVLLPAVMRALGDANWYCPAPCADSTDASPSPKPDTAPDPGHPGPGLPHRTRPATTTPSSTPEEEEPLPCPTSLK